MAEMDGLAASSMQLAGTALQAATAAQMDYWSYRRSQKLNEQNFEYNQQLMKQQNDYNIDMWNRTNDYNNPAAVAQRYADAGFNPAFMMSGQSATPAQTLTSANPSFNGNATWKSTMPDIGNLGVQFAQIQKAFSDAKLSKENARGQEIENDNKQRTIDTNIANTESQTLINKLSADLKTEEGKLLAENIKSAIINNELSEATFKDQTRRWKAEADKLENENDREAALASLAKIENEWAPVLKQKEANLLDEQANASRSSAALNTANAAAARQSIIESRSRVDINKAEEKRILSAKTGQDLNNKLQRKMNTFWYDIVHNKALLENDLTRERILQLRNNRDMFDSDRAIRFYQEFQELFKTASMVTPAGPLYQSGSNSHYNP